MFVTSKSKHGYFQIFQSPRPRSKMWVKAAHLLRLRVRIPQGHGGLSPVNFACSKRLLRRSDHLSRGVLASVVFLSAIVQPRKRKDPCPPIGCVQWPGGWITNSKSIRLRRTDTETYDVLQNVCSFTLLLSTCFHARSGRGQSTGIRLLFLLLPFTFQYVCMTSYFWKWY